MPSVGRNDHSSANRYRTESCWASQLLNPLPAIKRPELPVTFNPFWLSYSCRLRICDANGRQGGDGLVRSAGAQSSGAARRPPGFADEAAIRSTIQVELFTSPGCACYRPAEALFAMLNRCQIPRSDGLRRIAGDETGGRLLRHVAVVRSLIEIRRAECRSLAFRSADRIRQLFGQNAAGFSSSGCENLDGTWDSASKAQTAQGG